MKKLFALMLALCLLCSCCAFAEEEAEDEAIELTWESVMAEKPELAEMGQFQQIAIPDVATFIYWIPQNLSQAAVEVPEGQIAPAAYFATEDGNYTVSVFVLNITGLEEFAAQMQSEGADIDNARNMTVNGIQAVAIENAAADRDILLVPVTDTMVMLFWMTPLNGDEGWDAVKSVIVASLQLAQ